MDMTILNNPSKFVLSLPHSKLSWIKSVMFKMGLQSVISCDLASIFVQLYYKLCAMR